jgi:DNA-binding SARP family transcriptional activator
MKPIIYTDEVLLYGLARYYGLRRGTRRSSAGLAVSALLLTLYRVKGPIGRDQLMMAAGLNTKPVTFRTYVHALRKALGKDAIYLNGPNYQLSFEARRDMDQAFRFIQNELEDAIHPTRPAVLALVRGASQS